MARTSNRAIVPSPGDRVPVSLWLRLRTWMIANDPDAAPMLDWSRTIEPPPHADKLAGEIVWIILCAGKTAQAARTIETRVWDALDAGRPVVEAYGHRGRAAAIETVWHDRHRLFAELGEHLGDDDALLAWCRSLPWVGAITCYQLAKNLGRDVPKPDIWLCRLAGIPDRPVGRTEERFAACRDLCAPLAEASGDRVAAVDSLLWLACNKGVLTVDAQAGPVVFNPRTITARPIMSAFAPAPGN
ncbi:hypothetical protein MetexDRAFT_0679 [Methylorubrum extorquens DSM 13060]|nr:hypothetical protein MetexDRAFT_0679 [Methylorubrum extorquens DSM 13060]